MVSMYGQGQDGGMGGMLGMPGGMGGMPGGAGGFPGAGPGAGHVHHRICLVQYAMGSPFKQLQ